MKESQKKKKKGREGVVGMKQKNREKPAGGKKPLQLLLPGNLTTR